MICCLAVLIACLHVGDYDDTRALDIDNLGSKYECLGMLLDKEKLLRREVLFKV